MIPFERPLIMEVTVGPNTIRMVEFPTYAKWLYDRNGVYYRGGIPSPEMERLYAKKLGTHYVRCSQAVKAFMKQENPKRKRVKA